MAEEREAPRLKLTLPVELEQYKPVLEPGWEEADPKSHLLCKECGTLIGKQGAGKHTNSKQCQQTRKHLIMRLSDHLGRQQQAVLARLHQKGNANLQGSQAAGDTSHSKPARVATGAAPPAASDHASDGDPPSKAARGRPPSTPPPSVQVQIQGVSKSYFAPGKKYKGSLPETALVTFTLDNGRLSYESFEQQIRAVPILSNLNAVSVYFVSNKIPTPLINPGQSAEDHFPTAFDGLMARTPKAKLLQLYLEPLGGAAEGAAAGGGGGNKLKPMNTQAATKYSNGLLLEQGPSSAAVAFEDSVATEVDEFDLEEYKANFFEWLEADDLEEHELYEVDFWIDVPGFTTSAVRLKEADPNDIMSGYEEWEFGEDHRSMALQYFEVLGKYPALRLKSNWPLAKRWVMMRQLRKCNDFDVMPAEIRKGLNATNKLALENKRKRGRSGLLEVSGSGEVGSGTPTGTPSGMDKALETLSKLAELKSLEAATTATLQPAAPQAPQAGVVDLNQVLGHFIGSYVMQQQQQQQPAGLLAAFQQQPAQVAEVQQQQQVSRQPTAVMQSGSQHTSAQQRQLPTLPCSYLVTTKKTKAYINSTKVDIDLAVTVEDLEDERLSSGVLMRLVKLPDERQAWMRAVNLKPFMDEEEEEEEEENDNERPNLPTQLTPDDVY